MPSSVFSATLPVKPSQTTTSASPSSSARPSTLPSNRRPARLEQRVRLERQLVPLLRLLADREQPDARDRGRPRISSAKIEPMWANWSRCSGRASAFAPASMRTDGPCCVGITTAIPGRKTPGRRRTCRSDGREHRAGVPGRDDRVRLAVADGADRADERRVGLAAHGLRRLVVHLDRLGRVTTSSSPWASRPAGPKMIGDGSSADAAATAPATISSGRTVATEGVDGRPGSMAASVAYGAPGVRERLDVAAAVRLAGRAHVVRPRRRPAVRADVRTRGDVDAVLGAALVAAGLRGLSLGDCHERLAVYRKPTARTSESAEREPAASARRLEEAPVVRDDDERRRRSRERLLELLDGLEVEVVRRLVEDEEVDARAPAARRDARACARPARASTQARPTWSAPRPNFASSVRASTGCEPGRLDERVERARRRRRTRHAPARSCRSRCAGRRSRAPRRAGASPRSIARAASTCPRRCGR